MSASSRLLRLRRPLPLAGIALGTAGVLTAAVLLNPFDSTKAQAATDLPAYDDCATFVAGMRALALPRVGPYGFNRTGSDYTGYGTVPAGPAPMPMPMDDRRDAAIGAPAVAAPAAAAAPAPAAAAKAGAPAAQTYSNSGAAQEPAAPAKSTVSTEHSNADDAAGTGPTGTNVQEAGVDEADLAKTDGTLMITVVDHALQVVDVSGMKPRSRGTLDLGSVKPSELLLEGDRALVVSPAGPSTTLNLVDLSDPDRPSVIGTEEVGARYLSARLQDGIAQVVLSTPPQLSFASPGQWRDGDRMGADEATQANRDTVNRSTAEDWIPTKRLIDRDARVVKESPLVDCSAIRHPVQDSGMDLITVQSINARSAAGLVDAVSTAVVAAGDLVYESADKLFVATTRGGWSNEWISPAAPSGGFRGGPASEPERYTGVTDVHAFDLSGGTVRYLASGTIPGFVKDRWSFSERDGLLRVVYSTAPPWSWEGSGAQTGVIVLDTAGRRLDELGRSAGIGTGEQVKAVRWFDDLAAIVTFRQADPLTLVDLSKPTQPQVRGKLTVPGYSAYLHPIGDRRLLGVGQEADHFGRATGLQVSSFDILDVSDPRRTDTVDLGTYASSPVEQDARGFVYLPDDRMAVFPVQTPTTYCKADHTCQGQGVQGKLPYGPGLVSIHVAKDGTLREIAAWDSHRSGNIEQMKVMPLPGGRLVVLDGHGVSILNQATLTENGYVRF
jgi:Beta propeller domain